MVPLDQCFQDCHGGKNGVVISGHSVCVKLDRRYLILLTPTFSSLVLLVSLLDLSPRFIFSFSGISQPLMEDKISPMSRLFHYWPLQGFLHLSLMHLVPVTV